MNQCNMNNFGWELKTECPSQDQVLDVGTIWEHVELWSQNLVGRTRAIR